MEDAEDRHSILLRLLARLCFLALLSYLGNCIAGCLSRRLKILGAKLLMAWPERPVVGNRLSLVLELAVEGGTCTI